VRVGRGREDAYAELEAERRADRAEDVRVVARAAVPRAVDDVDGVARADKVRRPSRAAVRRPEVVRALPAAAVDEDERERPSDLDRRLPVHVHAPARHRADGVVAALVADEPEAAPRRRGSHARHVRGLHDPAPTERS
jgi:hypothetical protein